MKALTINPRCTLTVDDYNETTQAEMTNRLADDGDDSTEWYGYGTLAGLKARAVYYTTPEDAQAVEDNGGDWGAINWDIDHIDILTDDGVVVATLSLT